MEDQEKFKERDHLIYVEEERYYKTVKIIKELWKKKNIYFDENEVIDFEKYKKVIYVAIEPTELYSVLDI
jgi:hypothetical protein